MVRASPSLYIFLAAEIPMSAEDASALVAVHLARQRILRRIRYWYRELIIRSGKKKYSDLPDYDAIWFEGWATRLGEKHFK